MMTAEAILGLLTLWAFFTTMHALGRMLEPAPRKTVREFREWEERCLNN